MNILKSYIDFGFGSKPESALQETVVNLNDEFPLVLMIEHGGLSEEPIVFDTIILEVVYNNVEDVLIQSVPHDLPVAGELADNSPTTRDYYSNNLIRAGRATDSTPFLNGSQLTLEQKFSSEPFGGFRGRTGRAGLKDIENPFTLEFNSPPSVVAAGKLGSGFAASGATVVTRAQSTPQTPGLSIGKTTMLAVGHAFIGDKVIPISPEQSVVNVVTSRSDLDTK